MKRTTSLVWTAARGLVLVLALAAAIMAAVRTDRQFLDHLQLFQTGGKRPGIRAAWLDDLELPARRVHWDFLAFLAVFTLGIGPLTATARRGRRRCGGGLPGPGVAASSVAALVILCQVAERIALAWFGEITDATLGLVWSLEWPQAWSTLDCGLGLSPYQIEAGASGAVLGVWAYLFLARAWRAQNTWRDWLGRWLAWCWMLELGFQVFAPVIWR